jgi:hypothetical protein
MDGISFLPVLKGESHMHRTFAYGIHNNIPEGRAYPIRSVRDTKYKLIHNLTSDSLYYNTYAWNVGRHPEAYIMYQSWIEAVKQNVKAMPLVSRYVKRPEFELYDIQNDPNETANLILKPELQGMVQKLKTELAAWMKQQGDPGILLDVDSRDKH